MNAINVASSGPFSLGGEKFVIQGEMPQKEPTSLYLRGLYDYKKRAISSRLSAARFWFFTKITMR
jgi:hypothetical protein